ncbi:SDR family NAD(P)-dependent oxidoreductase [Scytonema sp. PRP1]|uniref:SDR family NAD(P)-dependent oxidoreductase n=1 Tax=Scytonema sp. PRP1 TaxID=3120513 RepID=UPI00300CA652
MKGDRLPSLPGDDIATGIRSNDWVPVALSRAFKIMDLQLTGKVALVSGSTAGIGLAIATTLAQEGATVIVNGRTEARVNAAIDQIKQKQIEQKTPDVKLQGLAADLGTSDGANTLFQGAGG